MHGVGSGGEPRGGGPVGGGGGGDGQQRDGAHGQVVVRHAEQLLLLALGVGAAAERQGRRGHVEAVGG